MPEELQNQYKIEKKEVLSNLLLSPRSHEKEGMFMSCNTCYQNIMNPKCQKPPKFGISNGWAIGQIPYMIQGEGIEDILSAALAKVRIFANIYSYTAGAHKSIKGDHTFFLNNPEYVGATFNYMLKSGMAHDMWKGNTISKRHY